MRAWLERSRVSSPPRDGALSRFRVYGSRCVRHDPVSESLRVLRRGLARRFMTRHHRLRGGGLLLGPASTCDSNRLSRDRRRAERPANRSSARDRACARSRRSFGSTFDRRRPERRGDRRSSRSEVRIVRRSGLRRSGVRIVRRSGLRRSGVRIRAAAPPRAPADLGRLDRVGDGSRNEPSRLCWRMSCPGEASAPTPDERGRRFAEGERWPTPARADSPGR